MSLIYYPDLALLKKCKSVPNTDKSQQHIICYRLELAKAMWKIMDHHGGVGLAAPQVGLNIRMFVWKHYGINLAIWNPILTWLDGEIESTEGCLSLPNVQVTIKRATKSDLSGSHIQGLPNRNNVSSKIKLFGDSSITRIWQHEIDHLDGKLIIDNMNRQERITNRDAMQTLLKNAGV